MSELKYSLVGFLAEAKKMMRSLFDMEFKVSTVHVPCFHSFVHKWDTHSIFRGTMNRCPQSHPTFLIFFQVLFPFVLIEIMLAKWSWPYRLPRKIASVASTGRLYRVCLYGDFPFVMSQVKTFVYQMSLWWFLGFCWLGFMFLESSKGCWGQSAARHSNQSVWWVSWMDSVPSNELDPQLNFDGVTCDSIKSYLCWDHGLRAMTVF